MPGDGVSLPTTLAQMGSVAKTQARGQQTTPQVTPFSEQKDDQNELKVQRVTEAVKTEKSRVAADQEEKDKRKRRRLKRHRKGLKLQAEDNAIQAGQDNPEDEEKLGCLIDLRV